VAESGLTELAGLAARLQGLCLARRLSVAAAESCTGGLIAETLTSQPGSSGYFLGSVVAYANAAKIELLGVPGEVLEKHGAVSAQVARAMAEGARERFGADLTVAVTGVAGPDGGTPEKPVGLTYVAIAEAAGSDVRRLVFGGDRAANRDGAADAAISWLIERAEAREP
jgi:PncC family amidohydrolase